MRGVRRAFSRPDRKRLLKHWIVSWIALPAAPTIWSSLGGFHEMDALAFIPGFIMFVSFVVGLAAPMALITLLLVKTPFDSLPSGED